MTSKEHDWKYYLSVYGSDLSRWPKEVVQNINTHELQKTELFKETLKLDNLLSQTLNNHPSGNFRAVALENIFDEEQEISWAFVGILSSFRQSVITISLLAVCLISGVQFSEKLYTKSSTDSNSVMWLGPTTVLKGYININENEVES